MIYLLLGLAAFFALHSLRVVAPGWRAQRIAAWGEGTWKVVYSLLSIAAFVLLVWGYVQAGRSPVLVWVPPPGLRHAVALLTLPAFILLLAAYVPRNHLRAKLGHPMLLGTKLWAAAHLLANGWLHAMLLFGAFLVWAALTFRSARRRPALPSPGPPSKLATLATVVLGVLAWAAFALYLHARLIGVAPFGR